VIDERPDDQTDMASVREGEVVSRRRPSMSRLVLHVSRERVIETSKRLVDHGRDVVILWTSITLPRPRLQQWSRHLGKVLTGASNATRCSGPNVSFFGAARTIEDGGLAHHHRDPALVDTRRRMGRSDSSKNFKGKPQVRN